MHCDLKYHFIDFIFWNPIYEFLLITVILLILIFRLCTIPKVTKSMSLQKYGCKCLYWCCKHYIQKYNMNLFEDHNLTHPDWFCSMTETNVPLLNSYKKRFVYKRVPQTFSGGLKLALGSSTQWYIYFGQVLVWSFPWIIALIFTLLSEFANLSILLSSLLPGIITAVLAFIFQVGFSS